MDKVLAWLKSKNITSHTIAVALVTFATLYTTDPVIRDFVNRLFANHPVILADIASIAGVIFKYSHSSSAAGLLSASGGAQKENNA